MELLTFHFSRGKPVVLAVLFAILLLSTDNIEVKRVVLVLEKLGLLLLLLLFLTLLLSLTPCPICSS